MVSGNLEIIKNFERISSEFRALFGVNSKQNLIKHLSKINIETVKVCAKQLKRNDGAWTCKDCEKDSSCIICNDCYDKSNHEGHRVSYKPSVSGCCDCGDPDSWNSEGFCTEHKGIITDDKEIQVIVNKILPDISVQNRVKVLFDELFLYLNQIILDYERNKNNNLVLIISSSLELIDEIAQSNFAMRAIIVEKMWKNYPLKTNHACLKFWEENDGLKFESFEQENEDHYCKCCFFRNLLSVWDNELENSVKIEKIFMNFLKSYKFKFLFGYTYISMYEIIAKKKCENIRNFGVQIITIEDISIKIAKCSEFFNNFILKVCSIFRSFDLNVIAQCEKSQNFIIEFFYDMIYFTKKKTSELLAKNNSIYLNLVDLLETINNENRFKVVTSFQNFDFNERTILIELFVLKIFSLFSSIYEYSDFEKSNEILFFLIDKVVAFTENKMNTDELNEYSFHNTLSRGLSIFLSRYLQMHYINTGSDIIDSISLLLNLYIKSRSLNIDIYQLVNTLLSSTFECIGFINSINSKHWVYYGDHMMSLYYYYYCEKRYNIFMTADYNLIKYFLPFLNEGKIDFFNLLNKFDFLNTYSETLDSIFDSKSTSFKEKAENLLNENFWSLINIINQDNFLLELNFVSHDEIIPNKIKDNLFEYFLKNDKENLRSMCINEIIHLVIEKGNSALFSEIKKSITHWMVENLESDFESIVDESCDQVKNKNKPVYFKIKNELLSSIDIFFYNDMLKRSKAEKYLNEFHKNTFNAILSKKLDNLVIFRNLNKVILEKLSKPSILTKSIKLLSFYIQNKSRNYSVFTSNLKVFQIFSNIFLKSDKNSENHVFLKESAEYFIGQLDEILKSDNSLKMMIDTLITEIKSINQTTDQQQQKQTSQSSNDVELRKKKIQEMKQKQAAQFKLKSENFMKEADMLETKEELFKETNNNKEIICCACKFLLNLENIIENPFGRIGWICKSNILIHAKIQTLFYQFKNVISPDNEVESQEVNLNQNEESGNNNMMIEEVKINEQNEIKSNTKTGQEANIIENEDIKIKKNFTQDEFNKMYSALIDEFNKNNKHNYQSLNITSCGHFIHYDCYNKLIIKYCITAKEKSLNIIEFSCPLCKNYSNSYLPYLEFLNKLDEIKTCSYGDYLSSQDKASLLCNIQNPEKYKKLTFQLSRNIEDLLTHENQKNFLFVDFNKNFDKNFSTILKILRYNISMFEIIGIDQFFKNFSYIKNLIYNLKLLIKLNYFDKVEIFKKFEKLVDLSNIYGINDLFAFLQTNELTQIIDEIFLLFLVLFDDDTSNFYRIYNTFIPLLIVQNFIAESIFTYKYNNDYINNITLEKFENYVGNDLSKFKKSQLYYLRKYITTLLIYNENSLHDNQTEIKQIKHNMNFTEHEEEFDYFVKNQLGLESLNSKIMTNKDLNIIFEKISENINNFVCHNPIDPVIQLNSPDTYFCFIKLPRNLLDLLIKYKKIICPTCNTTPPYSLVCLLCGEKLCYMNTCCNKFGENENQYEFQHHAKKCSKGFGCFITIYNGRIVYTKNNEFVLTEISPYRNKFGEGLKNKNTSSDYSLDETEFNLIKEDFLHLRFLKFFKVEIKGNNHRQMFNELFNSMNR